jgi:hypothetical protein
VKPLESCLNSTMQGNIRRWNLSVPYRHSVPTFTTLHGLGGPLVFFDECLPVVKNLAPSTLRTTVDFIEDVAVRGKSWKDAAFERIPQTLSKLAFSRNSQSGSGLRRKKTVERRSKRCRRDIFS